jgi:hypothetical protein
MCQSNKESNTSHRWRNLEKPPSIGVLAAGMYVVEKRLINGQHQVHHFLIEAAVMSNHAVMEETG